MRESEHGKSPAHPSPNRDTSLLLIGAQRRARRAAAVADNGLTEVVALHLTGPDDPDVHCHTRPRHTALTCKKRPISSTSRQAGTAAERSSPVPAGRDEPPGRTRMSSLSGMPRITTRTAPASTTEHHHAPRNEHRLHQPPAPTGVFAASDAFVPRPPHRRPVPPQVADQARSLRAGRLRAHLGREQPGDLGRTGGANSWRAAHRLASDQQA